MSTPYIPKPVLFFTAVLFDEKVPVQEVLSTLYSEYGPSIFESRLTNFVWSEYYEKEMGNKLKRIFVVFKDLVNRDELPELKRRGDKLEAKFTDNGKRTVNIDPGLICLENVELSTNKGFSHRIYLRDGVYAEVTLFYKNNSFQPIEYWTYRNIDHRQMVEFFNTAREILILQR